MADLVTRKHLEAVIDRGEAVVFNGQHILSKDHLPSESDLRGAQGPAAKRAEPPKEPTAAKNAATEKE